MFALPRRWRDEYDEITLFVSPHEKKDLHPINAFDCLEKVRV